MPQRRSVAWFTLAVSASVIAYIAILILSQSSALRLTPTRVLAGSAAARAVLVAITPPTVATAKRDSAIALVHTAVFALVVCSLIATWLWMTWLVRPGRRSPPRLRWILVASVVASAPLFVLVGIFSADVYLYAFYGRIVETYSANPYLVAPAHFTGDPHLRPVYWSQLTSAYGPVWIAVSTAVSRVAGDSLAITVLLFKLVLLATHLATTILVAKVLRVVRPEWTTWGAVFYGLNPLALFEMVGNAHSDGLLALLIVAAVLALTGRRRRLAGALLGAAIMTKVTAAVFVPLLVVSIMRGQESRRAGVRAAMSFVAAATATALMCYVPFWAGTALIGDILRNPASTQYLNSVWDLLRNGDPSPRLRVVPPVDRAVLLTVFVLVLSLMVDGVRRGRSLVDALYWTWVAYCFALAWIWPWYLVPALPLAALSGPGRSASVTIGLTLGALLFWTGWTGPPHPMAPWLVQYRSLLLFGPALVVLVVPIAREAVGTATSWGLAAVQALGRSREAVRADSADA